MKATLNYTKVGLEDQGIDQQWKQGSTNYEQALEKVYDDPEQWLLCGGQNGDAQDFETATKFVHEVDSLLETGFYALSRWSSRGLRTTGKICWTTYQMQ